MDEQTSAEVGIKRRSLIKRAGIVGAGVAAWTSPTLTSLASRAYAGSAPSDCKTCTPFGFPVCGSAPNPYDNTCYCFGKADGTGCFCGNNNFCSNLQTCTTNADCPSGYQCTDGNTGCGTQVCIANCDNTQGVNMQDGSGPTAASRG